jgi:histidinol-phosphatase (PHP family)
MKRQHHTPLVSYHGGHTLYDGAGEPERFVEAAIQQGFIALGFSEHMPPPEPYTYEGFPPYAEARRLFDRYVEEITRLQQAYRAEIPVLVGVEIEYIPEREAYVDEFLNAYPFDYTVGSVHWIGSYAFDYDEATYAAGVAEYGGLDAWVEEYYRIVRALLEMGVTDVLGHLDIIKIFAPPDYRTERVRAAEQETLRAAKDADVVLDVNARGLIKSCAEVYPGPDLLAEAYRHGVSATLGDDSHAADQVGMRLEQAADAMREAGYDAVTALMFEGPSVVRRDLPLYRAHG